MKPTHVQDSLESKIHMQGISLQLTDGLQEHIREKFGRLLSRNEKIVRIDVKVHLDQTIGKEHHYNVTGQIVIGGPDLVASAEGQEVYGLIDGVVEKLDLLLERRHGKIKEHRNHPHAVELDADIPKTETAD